MEAHDRLAEQFESNRAHLRAVAYRMLGSSTRPTTPCRTRGSGCSGPTGGDREPRRLADDCRVRGCASTTLRLARLAARGSARTRRRSIRSSDPPTPPTPRTRPSSPTRSARAVRRARDAHPAERLAFVLHDMFAVPFDEIAPIVGPFA